MDSDTLIGLMIILFILFFGLIIGFFIGSISTMKAVAVMASRFVDVDYNTINAALHQYSNNINGCYPIKFNITK